MPKLINIREQEKLAQYDQQSDNASMISSKLTSNQSSKLCKLIK